MHDEVYSGVKEIVFNNDDEVAKFYETMQIEEKIKLNEYLIIKDKDEKYIDRYRFDGNKLIHFQIKVIDNSYIKKLKPKNYRQQCCFDLLQNDSIPVKLITGNMGSGKTFLAFHHSLDKLERDKNFKKIVYIRNTVDVKDVPNLGALPNGLKEKLLPYILPLADCIGNQMGLEILEKQDKIEYMHLGFARGRNFSNSIILVSESENLTREHVALLLGRVGEGSIIIFEGDVSQVDKKVFQDNSGIQALKNVLNNNPLFGCVHLDKSERSQVAELSSLF